MQFTINQEQQMLYKYVYYTQQPQYMNDKP